METPQQQMKARLESIGLPFRTIDVYGSQIVVTCQSRNSAAKWADLLAKFATVRGMTHSVDYAKKNTNTVMRPTTIEVWRTFARV
jgi:hypothetical protein